MTKYDIDFKLRAVKQYLSSRSGFKRLSKEYGLAPITLARWVASYQRHGIAGVSQKVGRYSAQFRLAVLRRMWREELSHRQAAILFNIRGGSTVGSWERLYHEGGLPALEPKSRGRPKTMPAPKLPQPLTPHAEDSRTLDELRQENAYLRAEVAYLKKLKALRQAKEQTARKKRG
jgi:transposase